jgi:hypothetical protein
MIEIHFMTEIFETSEKIEIKLFLKKIFFIGCCKPNFCLFFYFFLSNKTEFKDRILGI